MLDILNECYVYACRLIDRGCPSRLTDQLKFVAGEQLWSMRTIALRHALAERHLADPGQPGRSAIAMYMLLLA